MKKTVLVLATAATLWSCGKNTGENASADSAALALTETSVADPNKIGAPVDASGAVGMGDAIVSLTGKDSLDCVIKAKVTEVCQSKGCWMMLENGSDKPVRVEFKDYALFMPKDLAGKEVVLHGIASKKEVSIDDLKHFAKDGGKSDAEIAKITAPEMQFTVVADGVEILKP